jgi:general secretion pathway protein G
MLRKRTLPLKADSGFTLLELLVTLTILAMIAAIAGPMVFERLGSSKTQTAKVQVQAIATALELYALDTGGYPAAQLGLGALIQAAPGVNSWRGPYLKRADGLIDPWNKPYLYRVPGRGGAFEVFTLGRDGNPGGAGEDQDISSN